MQCRREYLQGAPPTTHVPRSQLVRPNPKLSSQLVGGFGMHFGNWLADNASLHHPPPTQVDAETCPHVIVGQ